MASGGPPWKKPRLGLASSLAFLPVRPLLRAREPNASEGSGAKKVCRDDDALMQRPTPYGPLRKSLKVPTNEGDRELDYLCPFAWLHVLCEGSETFSHFLLGKLRGSSGRLVLYCDECRPGNALRPDKGRAYAAVYWSLVDFPPWFRSSQSGWIATMFISAKQLQAVQGGISKVMEQLLLRWWPREGLNLEVHGVRVKAGPDREIARLKFSTFLGDEKALKEICQAKGASGVKPCISCANIVGRCDSRLDPTSPLRHFSCDRPQDFDMWTAERLQEAANAVKECWRVQPRGRAEELEKMLGLSYEPGGGLLWGDAAGIAKIPEKVCWDHMHCLWASGGVAQLECNQFILAVGRLGLPLQMLQDFMHRFRFPGRHHLRNFLLEDRIVQGADSHMKAFASETLCIISVLAMFGLMVLEPQGQLLDHVRCMCHLATLRDYFMSHGNSRLDPSGARRINGEHHRMFVNLYPMCVRPKLHYTWHCIDGHDRFGAILGCFAGERKHRESKQTANFAFRSFCKTLLTRSTVYALGQLSRATAVQEVCLVGRERLEADGSWRSSGCMRSKWGLMSKGDMLPWQEGRPEFIGEALRFKQSSLGDFVAEVALHEQKEGMFWVASGQKVLIQADNLLRPLAFIDDPQRRIICRGWEPA